MYVYFSQKKNMYVYFQVLHFSISNFLYEIFKIILIIIWNLSNF